MGPLEREAWTARHLIIPQRLRSRRCELGLTQKQVVSRLGRSGIRTSNRALSAIEHGSGVDVAKLPELAAALDCTVTYLLGLTDDPQRWEPDAPISVAAPTMYTVAETCLILGDGVPERGHRYGTA